jgi:hypothetical protein
MEVTEKALRLLSSGRRRGSDLAIFIQQLQLLTLKTQIGVALVGGYG